MNPLHALNLELLAQGYATNVRHIADHPNFSGSVTQIIIAQDDQPSDFMVLISLNEEPHLVSLRHRTIDLREPNSIDRILRTIHKWQPPPTSSPPSPNS